ncbi:hypothetical protein HAX54_029522 [Datura stramonium]|uniref:Uncharacterized protein n=1 Tax=Datura stramonium TaxID=4076 RepID=A0ABS8V7D7_DATST|nr:hypothetical protein [Datura stramonium]
MERGLWKSGEEEKRTRVVGGGRRSAGVNGGVRRGRLTGINGGSRYGSRGGEEDRGRSIGERVYGGSCVEEEVWRLGRKKGSECRERSEGQSLAGRRGGEGSEEKGMGGSLFLVKN